LDSDSRDGSDLDEEDNAYGDVSSGDDSEEDKEETFRTHVEAPDLSVRARGNFGDYLKGLEWKFEPITDSTSMREPYRKYSGRHGLKSGMADRFNDPLECLAECGGLTTQFMARLAANSNDYYYHQIKPSQGRNLYCNARWKDITTAEMYQFFGIMLRISLATVDGGGYTAYFADEDRVIYADSGRNPRTMTLSHSKGWAQQHMTLNRFKQIRGAFHPEDKVASLGKDKCYQLRHILNQLNAAALRCFVMGPNMAFDEGGSPCRSRMCPVRQYNKDKPDKYRVDFYILSDSKYYFIYHMDVYQGKNDHNAYVDKIAAELPTTQKAVVNAIIKTGLDMAAPEGYRYLASDNKYNCNELLGILRDKCRVYGGGTCRKRRRGFDADQLNMVKSSTERGDFKLLYDAKNEIINGQWRDSKVVNFASSVTDPSITEVFRQIKNRKLSFPCPRVLVQYQKTMFGVDKGDQIRMHGGGFARKAHFQKWYKKAFFAVADCMLLNSLIAWNLSCSHRTKNQRRRLQRHEFYHWIAEAMLNYSDPTLNARSPEQIRDATAGLTVGEEVHLPMNAPVKSRCVVCKLDANLAKRGETGVMDNTHTCSDPNCDRIAHNGFLSDCRKIHGLDVFKGMTCFEIIHSKIGREVWAYKGTSLVTGKRKSYSVNYSHVVVQELRRLHGLIPQQQRRKRNPSTHLFRWNNDDRNDDSYNADTEEANSQESTTQR